MNGRILTAALAICGGLLPAAAGAAPGVVYEGDAGPGKGKHVVLVAGDQEYRSEEALPALGRILARHHGFKCTVLFTVDPATGFIDPACPDIPGLEALKTADLMVIFLRFQNLPKEQMQHIVDYLDAGKPVIGLRTATHAFKIPKDGPFAKYSTGYGGDDFKGGFGRQILGETWVGHYGKNHQQSTRLILEEGESGHPILRGVKDVWVQCGGYQANPIEGSRVLFKAQPLNGMTPDAPPDATKPPVPGAWARTYKGESARVFATTYGASEDFLNDGFRRLLVNACFWCAGVEEAIRADAKIDFVGPYHPATFGGGGWRGEVKPSDLTGWESPIMPMDKPIGKTKKK